jgi:chaperone required for assembly of F1-ATPase
MTNIADNDTGSANDNEPVPQGRVRDGQGREGLVREGLGKESLRPPLPKRFYKTAEVAATSDGFALLLDGRGVKTPKKTPLILPSEGLAGAIAAEWMAQGERIDPATMPLTRLANTTIDAVTDARAEVAADIVAFAGTDALCYRAEPDDPVFDQQAPAWDPVLAWAGDVLGARFIVQQGIRHVAQSDDTLAAVAKAVDGYGVWPLAALHVMTTLTGSAVLALAVARGHLTVAAAWTLAHVDEDWQMSRWGTDDEAQARRQYRWGEMQAAARFLALSGV